MERKLFKAILWATIEDYVLLIHLPPEIYNEIDEKYDDRIVEIAKKILLFYLENDFISLFYDNLENPKFVPNEISKEKAKELISDDSSWDKDLEGVFITASATKKGEELYYSWEIMDEKFKLPKIL